MDRKEFAGKLLTIASDIVPVVSAENRKGSEFNVFAALRDVREAQDIVEGCFNPVKKMTADAAVMIDKLPGFSPMQLRQQINQIVDVRQKAAVILTQYEAVIKELKGLEDIEASGVAKLKEAAAQVKEKEKFLVQAEKGLLEFTAFVQRKRPGVEQMLADPTSTKFGDKAGDFFNRIGLKLGKEVQAAVETIYRQTEEDLTHMADCVRGLKVVEKTASVHIATVRKAGLADVVISVKDWISGKSDAIAARLINFAGDIERWVRGFIERTNLVRNATKDLLTALGDSMDDIDSELKAV
jgi:hypothetical protein